jgi:hypothetical protein
MTSSTGSTDILDHRQYTPQFFLCRYRFAPGAARFAADIDDVRPLFYHLHGAPNRRIRSKEIPAVRE